LAVSSLDLDILGLLEHSRCSDQPPLGGGKNFVCPSLDNCIHTIACHHEAVPLHGDHKEERYTMTTSPDILTSQQCIFIFR